MTWSVSVRHLPLEGEVVFFCTGFPFAEENRAFELHQGHLLSNRWRPA